MKLSSSGVGVLLLLTLLSVPSVLFPHPAAGQPVGRVEVRAADQFGRPVGGGAATVISLAGYEATGVFDPFAGAIVIDGLPGGDYTLTLARQGYREVSRRVVVEPGGSTLVSPVLVSDRPSGLVVTVAGSAGEPVARTRVTAAGPVGWSANLFSDAAGRVVLADVPSGPWVIAVRAPDGRAAEAAVAVLLGDDAAVEIALPDLPSPRPAPPALGSRRPLGPGASVLPLPAVAVLPAPSGLPAQGSVRSSAPAVSPAPLASPDSSSTLAPTAPPLFSPALARAVPSHTVLLVDGVRRHRSAVVAWPGAGVLAGAHSPDFHGVPAIAVDRIEVLAGAPMALYGGDAAGAAVQMRLKSARSGGSFVASAGQHADPNDGDPSTCRFDPAAGRLPECRGVGERAGRFSLAANTGLPLGRHGFVNLSAEYSGAEPVSRTVGGAPARGAAVGLPVRDTPARWGAPAVDDDVRAFVNLGSPLGSHDLRFHGGWSTRLVSTALHHYSALSAPGVYTHPHPDAARRLLVGDAVWASRDPDVPWPPSDRLPGTGGCPHLWFHPGVHAATADLLAARPGCFSFAALVPGGFTPIGRDRVVDASASVQVSRTYRRGFHWTAGLSAGLSAVDHHLDESLNPSLGPVGLTGFDLGSTRSEELRVDLNAGLPVFPFLHVGGGLEHRSDRWAHRAGEPDSWTAGPFVGQGFAPGAQGLSGYLPGRTAGRWSRRLFAGHGTAELGPAGGSWSVLLAHRVEAADALPGVSQTQLAGRSAWGSFGLRASWAAGSRLPSLVEQHGAHHGVDYLLGAPRPNWVLPAAAGGWAGPGVPFLRPEGVRAYTAGFVYNRSGVVLDAGYFSTRITDRILLSDQLRNPAVRPFVHAARFFLPVGDTLEHGYEAVGSFTFRRLSVNAAWSRAVLVLEDPAALVGPGRHRAIEHSRPADRRAVGAAHPVGPVVLSGRLGYWGAWFDPHDALVAADLGLVAHSSLFPLYAPRWLADASVDVPVPGPAVLTLGVDNLLNAYPEPNPTAPAGPGNRYGEHAPHPVGGAVWYGRLAYAW